MYFYWVSWCFLLFWIHLYELVNGRSTIIFVIPVFMAAFLLGPGGSLIYSLLVAIELLILSWAGNVYQSGAENFTPMIILIISGFMALVSGWNTERSIRETRRLSSQRAAILQGISDGVILFDPEGKVIVHNSSASRILNRQLDNCSIKELLERSRRPGKCRQDLRCLGWPHQTRAYRGRWIDANDHRL